jgi:basic membrane protein A
MKYQWKIALAALLVLALTMGACQSATPPAEEAPPEEEGPRRVAVLFPGVVYDNSWNQAGFEGVERAAEECEFEFAYTESVGQEEQEEVFRNYALEGYNFIMGHGGEYYDAISVVAGDFPDIDFGVVNSNTAGGNVSSVVSEYYDTWYMAGVAACNMTETNKVAMVLALELPHLEPAQEGFRAGAATCGTDTEVDIVVTGSFVDVNLANEAAQAMIEGGADVLIHHMDTADVGMFSAAEDAGVMCIGAYRDQSDISDCVIASVLGGPETYDLACGKLTDGEVHPLTLAAGAIDLHMTDKIPDDVKAKVEEAREFLLGEGEAPTAGGEPERVAVLFPGVVYDNSWNQAGFEGVERAAEDCNFDFVYTESVGQEEQEEVFRNYALEGYDRIMGHGGEYYDAISVIAGDFPDIDFGVVNSNTAGGNVTTVVSEYFDTWYMAGVAACNMTETNKVAMVLALELPHLEPAQEGFRLGAATCGTDTEVDIVVTGSFVDVNLANEAAQAMIEGGADVLIHHMDTADVGMFSAAEDAGVMCIGAYRDQSDVSECVIASVLGGPETYDLACGKLTDGEVHPLTLADGAIDLHMTDKIPDDVKAKVEEAREALLSGEVESSLD